MREWFIIDRRSGKIVNCATTSNPNGPRLDLFLNGEHLYATTNPTQEQLNGYYYYWNRP